MHDMTSPLLPYFISKRCAYPWRGNGILHFVFLTAFEFNECFNFHATFFFVNRNNGIYAFSLSNRVTLYSGASRIISLFRMQEQQGDVSRAVDIHQSTASSSSTFLRYILCQVFLTLSWDSHHLHILLWIISEHEKSPQFVMKKIIAFSLPGM